MEDWMISADEARQKSKEAFYNKHKDTLEDAMEAIKVASSSGHYYTRFFASSEDLARDLTDYLEEAMGYLVTCKPKYDEVNDGLCYELVVSWG